MTNDDERSEEFKNAKNLMTSYENFMTSYENRSLLY